MTLLPYDRKRALDLVDEATEANLGSSGLIVQLAAMGQVEDALAMLGQLGTHASVGTLASCASSFDEIEPGLGLEAVREAVSVAGWRYPEWEGVRTILTEAP